jgi:hypothetical protein
MQNDLTESVQASIRPGEMVDTTYCGETNLTKQAYPSVVNTRFVQNFTNLGQGSSQFVISPQGGVSDIILQFTTPLQGQSGADYTNLALNAGWGYALINRLSVRYGSSAQYFWSGPQMYLQNMLDAEINSKSDNLTTLGGASLTGTAAASAGGCGGATAYVYLKLPHNSVRAAGKPLPFPSDLLVQPIVITVELFSPQAIVFANTSGVITTAPATLASAQMQVKQEMLTDTSDQLARRVDMNTHAYTFPLMYFCQQEVQIPIAGSATSLTNSVNLTGFRAGEVKSIILWLTPAANSTPGNATVGQSYLPLTWYPINNVVLTYNGEIFSRFDVGSAALWNLTTAEKVAAVSTTLRVVGGTANAYSSPWVECPFAQVMVPKGRDAALIHGKPILNAVVNLQFDVPALSTAYVLHAMYLYNSSLLCSRGSAEYIF